MSNIISINKLSYSYQKGNQVLNKLSLQVPRGAIYGFLGANGAGKTTTIRSMLGLIKPKEGNIKIFDQSINTTNPEYLKNIGSLVEAPAIYEHLSGFQNLKLICKYLNIPNFKITEVLEQVNLLKQKDKKTKAYSTGMKQRLGLAIALLNDPDLLILDEPTSGLDPNGIIEIRAIIQSLQQSGKTIFLSSHLLSEIEKLATSVGIIKNGSMIFEGSIEALEQLKHKNLKVKIRVNDELASKNILNPHFAIKTTESKVLEIDLQTEDDIPIIIEKLTLAQIKIYEVSLQKNNLEELFIDLTNTNQ